MINTYLEHANYITLPVPIAANNGVGPISGDLLLFGSLSASGGAMAGVASNSLTPPTGTPNTDGIGVQFCGAFYLTVQALTGLSPSSGQAVAPGDRVYASGGTYDPVTGCTYGCTLDCNSATGIYVGNALTAIPSGQTAVIPVRLKVGG